MSMASNREIYPDVVSDTYSIIPGSSAQLFQYITSDDNLPATGALWDTVPSSPRNVIVPLATAGILKFTASGYMGFSGMAGSTKAVRVGCGGLNLDTSDIYNSLVPEQIVTNVDFAQFVPYSIETFCEIPRGNTEAFVAMEYQSTGNIYLRNSFLIEFFAQGRSFAPGMWA
jgi:hypothetical protein